jgi:hypothetical protein
MIAAVLLAVHAYASSPQAAAIRAFPNHRAVRILWTHEKGRYATVMTTGGKLDVPVASPIVIERFPFGWQPLYFASEQHSFPRDSGSPNDVDAVRKLMRGPFVPFVRIDGGYAMGEWHGAAGGETYFKKTGGRWTMLTSSGGAYTANELQRYGIPHTVGCRLVQLKNGCAR